MVASFFFAHLLRAFVRKCKLIVLIRFSQYYSFFFSSLFLEQKRKINTIQLLNEHYIECRHGRKHVKLNPSPDEKKTATFKWGTGWLVKLLSYIIVPKKWSRWLCAQLQKLITFHAVTPSLMILNVTFILMNSSASMPQP